MNLFYEAKKVLDKDGKVNPLGPYGKQKLQDVRFKSISDETKSKTK